MCIQLYAYAQQTVQAPVATTAVLEPTYAQHNMLSDQSAEKGKTRATVPRATRAGLLLSIRIQSCSCLDLRNGFE